MVIVQSDMYVMLKDIRELRYYPFTSLVTVCGFGTGSNTSQYSRPWHPRNNSWLLIPYRNNVLCIVIRSIYNIWRSKNALGLPIALKLGIVFWKTILRVQYFDILMYVHGVSGVTAYKLDHSLRKLKLAEDCFHSRGCQA